MKDAAVETLHAEGHIGIVSDLFAMKFEAVLGADDFTGTRVGAETLSLAAEQTAAF